MNKKGMTLIEIIISIVLISIVLIFLFSLLITVKDINTSSKVNSTYLINKSLILKNIEEDFAKATSIELGDCNITDIYASYDDTVLNSDQKAHKCIKFVFDDPTNDVGYLGIYYYINKESYVISYIHKDVKVNRILPEYEKVPKNIDVDSNNVIKTWTYNGSNISTQGLSGGSFHLINIPIIGTDGKDYGINISYYKG